MAVSKPDYAAKSALAFFLRSIDYPEGAPADATSFVLQVDGGDITAMATGAALRLVFRLTDDAAELPRLAEFAAGRMLREDATLACDREGAFLWQETSETSDAHQLRRLFETFCDSCDWWRARLEPTADGGDVELSQNEMRILP
jgi:hypothetical protein